VNVTKIEGARTTLEIITVDGKTDDLGRMIIRGVIEAGDDRIEFYIDNDKKYGCLYERKETTINLDKESFEEGQ